MSTIAARDTRHGGFARRGGVEGAAKQGGLQLSVGQPKVSFRLVARQHAGHLFTGIGQQLKTLINMPLYLIMRSSEMAFAQGHDFIPIPALSS